MSECGCPYRWLWGIKLILCESAGGMRMNNYTQYADSLTHSPTHSNISLTHSPPHSLTHPPTRTSASRPIKCQERRWQFHIRSSYFYYFIFIDHIILSSVLHAKMHFFSNLLAAPSREYLAQSVGEDEGGGDLEG